MLNYENNRKLNRNYEYEIPLKDVSKVKKNNRRGHKV